MRFFFFRLLVPLILVLGAASAWWLWFPISLPQAVAEVSIEPGTSPKEVAAAVAKGGVPVNATLLYLWFRLSGQSRQIRAGSYEWTGQASPWQILRKLVRGDQSSGSVTIVEGWNIRQVREALRKADNLKPESAKLSDAQLMQALERPGVHPEGRFFPDTYTYSKGSTDLAVLRRAMRSMDSHLAAAWEQRNTKVPLGTPEQALILASIVEKETGLLSDQGQISAVFHNRLILGMRLQTDPTRPTTLPRATVCRPRRFLCREKLRFMQPCIRRRLKPCFLSLEVTGAANLARRLRSTIAQSINTNAPPEATRLR